MASSCAASAGEVEVESAVSWERTAAMRAGYEGIGRVNRGSERACSGGEGSKRRSRMWV